ncbi:MAG TPA: hypothetical protein VGI40_19230 [Pirellulaceae bacterium]
MSFPDGAEIPGDLRPPLAAWTYFLPFLAFFGPAFFDGVGFFAADFAPLRLPKNADSQPSEYF